VRRLSKPRYALPRGTRDLLPDEMVKRAFVERTIRAVFERYGFQEVKTPIFETFDLFYLRSGEDIRKKMFVFRTGDGSEVVLRPELTAPVCRMIAMGELDLSQKPLRVFYTGQCFRYEEPQAGRYREFWQAGLELMGSSHPEADAEVIAVAVRVLRELGLVGYVLRVGNVEMLRGFLKDNLVQEEYQNRIVTSLDSTTGSISKLKLIVVKLRSKKELEKDDKEYLLTRAYEIEELKEKLIHESAKSAIPETVLDSLAPDTQVLQVDSGAMVNPVDITAFIENKISEVKLIQKVRWVYEGVRNDSGVVRLPEDVARILLDTADLVGNREQIMAKARNLFQNSRTALRALDSFDQILDVLETYGVKDYVVDLSIARGLEFYTGTVFEIDFPLLGAQKQICGGGRYDKLVAEFGGPSTPATGFAFGFDRVVESLKRGGAALPEPTRVQIYVAPLEDESRPFAIRVTEQLREKGTKAEMDLMRRSLSENLAFASKLGIPYVIIIGRKEAKAETVTIRDMRTKEQKTARLEDLGELS